MPEISIWIQVEEDGQVDEAEFVVDSEMTVGDLQRDVFNGRVFRLPPDASEQDVQIGRKVADKFVAMPASKTLSEMRTTNNDTFVMNVLQREYAEAAEGQVVPQTSAHKDGWGDTAAALETARKVMLWRWDTEQRRYVRTAELANIDREPFSSGDAHSCYHVRLLSDNTRSYVAKCDKGGGSGSATETRERYKARVKLANVARHWAQQYREVEPAETLEFRDERAMELFEHTAADDATADGAVFFTVEPFLDGYAKTRSEPSHAADNEVLRSFAHFTYEASKRQLVVADARVRLGGGHLYAEPVVRVAGAKVLADAEATTSAARRELDEQAATSAGGELAVGLDEFASQHACGVQCHFLGMRPTHAGGAPSESVVKAAEERLRSASSTPARGSSGSHMRRRLADAPEPLVRQMPKDVKSRDKTYALGDIDDFGIVDTFTKHKEIAYAVVICGSLLYSASADKSIKAFDLDKLEFVRSLDGHRGDVTDLWLSRDEKTLYSASQDASVRVWDLTNGGSCDHTLQHADDVWGVCTATTATGEEYVVGAAGKNLQLWLNQGGIKYAKKDALKGHKKTIKALNAKGAYVFSGSNDKSIRVWDVSDGECKYVLNDHDGWIRDIYIWNTYLFSAAYDTSVKVWNLGTLECETTLTGPQRCESVCVWQQLLFVGTDDGRMKVYDTTTGTWKMVQQMKEHATAVCKMRASHRNLVSSAYDGSIKVWAQLDMETAPPED